MITCCILRIISTLFTLVILTNALAIIGEPVYHFSGNNDGANPQSTLTQVNNTGLLFGVTRYGDNSSDNTGVIYRIDTRQNNTFTVVYQFTTSTGCQPISPLVHDGTIFLFGSTIRCSQFGYGNLFRFNLMNYTLEIIYEFPDIANPIKLLLDTSSGLLYGVASVGSSTFYGSVFTIDIKQTKPSTTFKQLFSFDYRTGAFPSNLILMNHSLYINTEIFGEHGGGTLVKMNQDGKNAKLIYPFGADDALGCPPWGQLVRVNDEDQQEEYLYGTTMGAANCPSTIYRVRLSTGIESVEFVATLNETTVGRGPFDGLIKDVGSPFCYGVTSDGGMNDRGTMFRFNVSNGTSLEKLFDFPMDDSFGYETLGGLVQVGNSSFYGAANLGGKYGFGTIYQITIR